MRKYFSRLSFLLELNGESSILMENETSSWDGRLMMIKSSCYRVYWSRWRCWFLLVIKWRSCFYPFTLSGQNTLHIINKASLEVKIFLPQSNVIFALFHSGAWCSNNPKRYFRSNPWWHSRLKVTDRVTSSSC